eukprot:CAMPEP_0176477742 /NCGR_PEP_ID=MMETSP0200_2-20121128/799_1 /TAXON_ID=947934 /ORGANISM="Chaetoceros sp., Strain GSL56" /LENGTH=124 /DNA_ID=CAMNT_0017873601 /DNA_START=52 /DNA_END=426 /DNA_ORIENTATION=-
MAPSLLERIADPAYYKGKIADFQVSSSNYYTTQKILFTMAPSLLERIADPAYYKGKIADFQVSSSNYYKPLFRSGSVKPLWHLMAFTSVVMYTTNYIFLKGKCYTLLLNDMLLYSFMVKFDSDT